VRPSATVPSTKPPTDFTGAAALANHADPRRDTTNAVFIFMLHPPFIENTAMFNGA
jgi:hypothetical protein